MLDDTRNGTTHSYIVNTYLEVEAVFQFGSKIVIIQKDGTVTELDRRQQA